MTPVVESFGVWNMERDGDGTSVKRGSVYRLYFMMVWVHVEILRVGQTKKKGNNDFMCTSEKRKKRGTCVCVCCCGKFFFLYFVVVCVCRSLSLQTFFDFDVGVCSLVDENVPDFYEMQGSMWTT
jgi:hypothetical protein